MKTLNFIFGILLGASLMNLSQAGEVRIIHLKEIKNVETKFPQRSLMSSTQFFKDSLKAEALLQGPANRSEPISLEYTCESYLFPSGSRQNFNQVSIKSAKASKPLILKIADFGECERTFDKIKTEKEVKFKAIAD